ncbi:hypothetical protein EVAR_101091_1 [Eumeta japonica]|uniref:TraB domain-containing protein n=1 Tax=Eumeta variegata TaxID=151549 RepID=A0A4C1SX60_EUMVA|nr:hypothetical protein EVAR_101091_1 [Eumeta japonica]
MPTDKLNAENADEKRRRKTESLIHSSKQKLNIAIAEASAAESASPAAVAANNSVSPITKREIKIYDSIEEFEKNLPPTVTVLTTPFGSRVYLVGTAHFSESQDDVSFAALCPNSNGAGKPKPIKVVWCIGHANGIIRCGARRSPNDTSHNGNPTGQFEYTHLQIYF